jgi:hypothetical protein
MVLYHKVSPAGFVPPIIGLMKQPVVVGVKVAPPAFITTESEGKLIPTEPIAILFFP